MSPGQINLAGDTNGDSLKMASNHFNHDIRTSFYFAGTTQDGRTRLRIIKDDSYSFTHPDDYTEILVSSPDDILAHYPDFVTLRVRDNQSDNNVVLDVYAHPDSICYINSYNNTVDPVIIFRFQSDDIQDFIELEKLPVDLPDSFTTFLIGHSHDMVDDHFHGMTTFHKDYFVKAVRRGDIPEGTALMPADYIIYPEELPGFADDRVEQDSTPPDPEKIRASLMALFGLKP